MSAPSVVQWMAGGDPATNLGSTHTIITTTDPIGKTGWTKLPNYTPYSSRFKKSGVWDVTNDIQYANGLWIVSGHGKIVPYDLYPLIVFHYPLMTSTDGINWSFPEGFSDANYPFLGLKAQYNGTIWLVCGYLYDTYASKACIFKSTNAINWTETFPTVANYQFGNCKFNDIAWTPVSWSSNGLWIVVGKAAQSINGVLYPPEYVYISTDNGSTWTSYNFSPAPTIIPEKVVWFGDRAVIAKVANNGKVYVSESNYGTGLWTESQTTLNSQVRALTTHTVNNQILLIAGGIKYNAMSISYTTDGFTWSTGSALIGENVAVNSFSSPFAYNGSVVNHLAGSDSGKITFSTDGVSNWDATQLPEYVRLNNMNTLAFKPS